MQRDPQILLTFGWYDHRTHAGIVRYARERGWNLHVEFGLQHRGIPDQWHGDGMLLCHSPTNMTDTFDRLIQKSQVPTVQLSSPKPNACAASIGHDEKAICTLAAHHLLDRAFKHFMWVGDAPQEVGNQMRLRYFDEALREAGYACDVLWWPYDASGRSAAARAVAKVLRCAEKPLALVAVSDLVAAMAMNVCLEAGIRVPEEVAILGVGNNELYWNCTSVPLSSIEVQQNEYGYRAAELLDKLLMGEPVPSSTVLIPPLGIERRASTDVWATSHPRVRKAIDFMRNQYQTPIHINDVARHVGISREGMSKAFKASIQKSPGAILRSYRLEHAKRLLKTTDFKIDAVAADSGLRDGTRLCNIFRRELGMTPSAYRREAAG